MADVKIFVVTEGTEKALQDLTRLNVAGQQQATVGAKLGQQVLVNTKALSQFNSALSRAGGLLGSVGILSAPIGQFQMLSQAALGAASAINSVSLAMTAVATAKGGLIALGAVLAAWTGVEGFSAWKAAQQQAEAEAKLGEGLHKRADSLEKAAVFLADSGKITEETANRILGGIADAMELKDITAAADALARLSKEVLPLMPTLAKFELEQKLLELQIQDKQIETESVALATAHLSRREREGVLSTYIREQEELIAKAQMASSDALAAGVIKQEEHLQNQVRGQQALLALEQRRAELKRRDDAVARFEDVLEQQRQIGQLVVSPFQGLFDGIASSVQGLLNLTISWGEALRNIGSSVIQSIIRGFSEMVASWITSIALMVAKWVWAHVLMKGVLAAFHFFARLLGWETTTEQIAQETAKAPALAANAATASVSSYGAAAVVGMALALAAIGAIIGFALAGGFAAGGYTGGGDRSRIAGVVHNEEYVFSAPAVDRIGLPTLEALHEGEPIAASGDRMAFVLVDSREKANDLDMPGFRKRIVQIMGEEMHNFRR